MPNLNFLVFLNTYSDQNSSNDPNLMNFRWTRNFNGLPVQNPTSNAFTLAPGETRSIFSGIRTLSQDGTTQYSLSLVPLTTNTYQLSAVAGTLPNFRVPRTTGADATTQITVTQNGPLITFASTSGTPLSLISGSVQVGDFVRVGNLFNTSNQGEQQIIAFTATSFTVANELGVPEGPITLGSGFSSQIQIYSALGVQINDKLVISGGFSPFTQDTYLVTSVAANYLQFYTTDALPIEGPITTQAIAVYSMAKQLIYLESDQNCTLLMNGSLSASISPMQNNNSPLPGIFMNTSTLYSLSITNNSANTANLFMASAE